MIVVHVAWIWFGFVWFGWLGGIQDDTTDAGTRRTFDDDAHLATIYCLISTSKQSNQRKPKGDLILLPTNTHRTTTELSRDPIILVEHKSFSDALFLVLSFSFLLAPSATDQCRATQ